MSQSALAARIGRAQREVSSWERGTRCPRLDEIVALAGALSAAPSGILAALGPVGAPRPLGATSPDAVSVLVGARIRVARELAAIAPLDLARRCRIPPARLRALEGGADPAPAELGALAATLELDLDALLASGSLDVRAAVPTGGTHASRPSPTTLPNDAAEAG